MRQVLARHSGRLGVFRHHVGHHLDIFQRRFPLSSRCRCRPRGSGDNVAWCCEACPAGSSLPSWLQRLAPGMPCENALHSRSHRRLQSGSGHVTLHCLQQGRDFHGEIRGDIRGDIRGRLFRQRAHGQSNEKRSTLVIRLATVPLAMRAVAPSLGCDGRRNGLSLRSGNTGEWLGETAAIPNHPTNSQA